MKTYLHDLFQLFFPRVCSICGNALYAHESFICRKCQQSLPRSYFHMGDQNPLEQIFWGRIQIEKAASFLEYRKGNMVKSILHKMKYKDCKELGFEIGKIFGEELSEVNYFSDVDYIVPVPLHPKKMYLRGYNQSEWIANGINENIGVDVVTDNLFKVIHTSTQTKKGRYQRWENIQKSFDLRYPERFVNKHILIVDDVLTTGATIEACASQLLKVNGVKLSVATLAYATN